MRCGWRIADEGRSKAAALAITCVVNGAQIVIRTLIFVADLEALYASVKGVVPFNALAIGVDADCIVTADKIFTRIK